MGLSKPKNKCIECGSSCFGKRCQKCFGKGKHAPLARREAAKRYTEKVKHEKKEEELGEKKMKRIGPNRVRRDFYVVEGEIAVPENCARCIHSSIEDIKSDALIRCTKKDPSPTQERIGNHWFCKTFYPINDQDYIEEKMMEDA